MFSLNDSILFNNSFVAVYAQYFPAMVDILLTGL